MSMNRLFSLCPRLGRLSDGARRTRPAGANLFFSTVVDWKYGKHPPVGADTLAHGTRNAHRNGGRMPVPNKSVARCT